MILYHASKIGGIEYIEPRISNHDKPLCYFSSKKENVCVYLSNAVEKFWLSSMHEPLDRYYKWASYGFSHDKLRIEEYYKNALKSTYRGVFGYIYTVVSDDFTKLENIPFAYTCDKPVKVLKQEYIADAYEYILKLISLKTIDFKPYESLTEKELDDIKRMIKKEYAEAKTRDYKFFLEGNFDFLDRTLPPR